MSIDVLSCTGTGTGIGHRLIMVDVEELEFNLKRLVRDGFPKDGLPLVDFPAQYKKYFKFQVKDPSYYYTSSSCNDWVTLFKKEPLLKSSFRISRNSRTAQDVIKVLQKPQDNLKAYFKLVNYASFLGEVCKHAQFGSSDEADDDDDDDESDLSGEEEEDDDNNNDNKNESQSHNLQSSIGSVAIVAPSEDESRTNVIGSGSSHVAGSSAEQLLPSSSTENNLNHAAESSQLPLNQQTSSNSINHKFVKPAEPKFKIPLQKSVSAEEGAPAQTNGSCTTSCSRSTNANSTGSIPPSRKLKMSNGQIANPEVLEKKPHSSTTQIPPDKVRDAQFHYSPGLVRSTYNQFSCKVLTLLKKKNPTVPSSTLSMLIPPKWRDYLKETETTTQQNDRSVLPGVVLDDGQVKSSQSSSIPSKGTTVVVVNNDNNTKTKSSVPVKPGRIIPKAMATCNNFVYASELDSASAAATKKLPKKPIPGPSNNSTKQLLKKQQESESKTPDKKRSSSHNDNSNNDDHGTPIKRFKVQQGAEAATSTASPLETFHGFANNILAEGTKLKEKLLTMSILSNKMEIPTNWVVFFIPDSAYVEFGEPQTSRWIYKWDQNHKCKKFCPAAKVWEKCASWEEDLNIPSETILFGETAILLGDDGKKRILFSILDVAIFDGNNLMNLPFVDRRDLCSVFMEEKMSKDDCPKNTKIVMSPFTPLMNIDTIFNNIRRRSDSISYQYYYKYEDEEINLKYSMPIHGLVFMKVAGACTFAEHDLKASADQEHLKFLESMNEVWVWPFHSNASCLSKENLFTGEPNEQIGWWSFRLLVNNYKYQTCFVPKMF